jgi:hypothetical protein
MSKKGEKEMGDEQALEKWEDYLLNNYLNEDLKDEEEDYE